MFFVIEGSPVANGIDIANNVLLATNYGKLSWRKIDDKYIAVDRRHNTPLYVYIIYKTTDLTKYPHDDEETELFVLDVYHYDEYAISLPPFLTTRFGKKLDVEWNITLSNFDRLDFSEEKEKLLYHTKAITQYMDRNKLYHKF